MSQTRTSGASDRQRLAALRRFLLFTAMTGVTGMGLELIFVGHVADWLQWVPIVLLACGLAALARHTWRPTRASAQGVRLMMALFIASGLLGVALHFRGNREFELEMYPAMAGIELMRKTLTGATPVLAPGSMALLGLAGLAAVHGFSPGQDINEENAS
ncbi:MAG: hypothetical protein IT176_07400 [Acidobacteria bacterium]|nr:hypothetical protein [Acidobacteriota bacterium]